MNFWYIDRHWLTRPSRVDKNSLLVPPDSAGCEGMVVMAKAGGSAILRATFTRVIRAAGYTVLGLLLCPLPAAAQPVADQQLAAILLLMNQRMMSLEEEEEGPDPLQYYVANVRGPVVQAQCLSCHVPGGVAPSFGAQLVFSLTDDAANVEAIRAYNELRGDGGVTLLAKISGGQNHVGGAPFPPSSAEYQALAALIEILNAVDTRSADVEGRGFFAGVTLASPEQTLRRAALILAGRLPTDEEQALAEEGDAGLRQAVLGLMSGSGFHDFLIRGANDRLHTDGFLNGLFAEISDLNADGASFYPVGAARFFLPAPYTEAQNEARWNFRLSYDYGVARAPLELIAHVVENNLPYTEILTADYTMVNVATAEVFRSGVSFSPAEGWRTFKPGVNRGQVLQDDEYVGDFVQDSGFQVQAHSGFIEYPHAGLLNDLAWLNRYPSTETNRNRARARWTYYHFLGVDIEKSAPRTTDPVALSDTNNPTLNNPACTVCHERLDPVAGAYQNYGNVGFFRSSWGGHDALPDTYKYPEWFEADPAPSPYQLGDTWYRDMRHPGFATRQVPASQDATSLRWLGQQLVADPAFATAAVGFWWSSLMGVDLLAAPEVPSDPNYNQLARAFEAQQQDVATLATNFASGGFQLKSLLADMVLSPWFRGKAVDANVATTRGAELAQVGVDRLLTPEELEAKTEAVLGYAWNKWPDDSYWQADGFYSALIDRYGLYYGGIDSVGVKARSPAMTALMANVAERQALELACGVTTLDFFDNPRAEDRRLFRQVSASTTPLSEITADVSVPISDYAQRRGFDVATPLNAGRRRLTVHFNNDAGSSTEDRNLYIDAIEVYRDDTLIARVEGETFLETPGFSRTTYSNGEGMGGVVWGEVNGSWQPIGWNLWSNGFASVPFDLPADDDYRFRVIAWGSGFEGGGPQATFSVEATQPGETTRGSAAIKAQIRSLYKRLLGDDLLVDDPEIEAVYALLEQTWVDRRGQEHNTWAWYGEEEECFFPREIREEDWVAGIGSDPSQMLYSWASVIYYFLTHFDYLHE